MPLPTANLLADSASPYLIQHKDNPVHWRPWGPEALEEAGTLDRPILLSVGYAACHWCHVMAHESFEDPETADLMNALFVNIKVDREERPDIDQIYMGALHALGEQGGWPLTMFLTPGGEPFWGGTYFPKEPGFGRPGFRQVLEAVATTWRTRKDAVHQNRDAILRALSEGAGRPEAELDRAILDRAADRLVTLIDPVNGGTHGAPKFPQGALLELLWRAWRRRGEERFRDAVLLTLARISLGGIYDHLGGGFARYAVDERWLVPHFEKMLYDNAQLIDLLTHAWLDSGAGLFRARVEETVAWLEREMLLPGGAFAASLDADSEGEEGRFYVWTRDEIESALGTEDAAFFAELYDVSSDGNWEGRNVLNLLRARPFTPAEAERAAALRARLFAIRERRVRPGRDDKILADWNGLAIAALARAATAFDRPDWLARAENAFGFILRAMNADGRLAHAERQGRLVRPGLSTDYGAMIRAALSLHEATGEAGYLDHARIWAATLDRHHWVEGRSAYALAADDSRDVIIRLSSAADEAVPSGNALAADALVRLWLLTGEAACRDRADRLFRAFAGDVLANVFAHAGLLNALDTRIEPLQVAVVAPEGRGAAQPFLKAVWGVSNPNRVVTVVTEDALPASHPAFAKTAVNGKLALYVCRGETCSLPLADPAAAAAALR